MSECLLNVENSTKRFGGLVAVNEVNLKVRTGSIHALIGPNGSGKSTLLNLISGIYRLDSGQIVFGARKLSGLAPYQIARQGVGRTFQNIRLFRRLSVLQNVMVGQHFRNRTGLFANIMKTGPARRKEGELAQVALAKLKFLGLDDVTSTPSTSLPYGRQRMVEIARALVMDPQILLLDEPAAGMNPTESAVLLDRIRRINGQGITILLVEHNMRFVMSISERITVLDFGKVIAEGTPDEISCNPKVIEAYLGSGVNFLDEADE
jgi:branched-chain amino acid transport system ATP-binding protein